MRQDSISIDRFYSSRLGRVAADILSGRIVDLWQHTDGLSVLGLGHALPLLEPFAGSARRVVAALPDGAGALSWDPTGRGNATVLSPEARLPFADGLFDRAIVLHGLEDAESPRSVCRELWRVMAPEGRIVVAAANRRGLWARAERTPFGHGRPWTLRQLARLLADASFQVSASTHALFMPPVDASFVLAGSQGWESAGRLALPGLGGVVLVEAVKRLYIEPGGGAVAPAVSALPARKGARAMPMDRADRTTDGQRTGWPLTPPVRRG